MKVAFLDRDGVINKERNYVHKVEDFEYTNNCIAGLKILVELGYELIVVTNQAGIGKGYYDRSDYNKLTLWLQRDLKNHGVVLRDIFYCPHHPDASLPEYKKVCSNRKPQPGMFLTAKRKYDIRMSESIVIGDKISDIEAGEAAGVGRGILVKSGHPLDLTSLNDYMVSEDLYQASLWLAREHQGKKR